MSTFGGFFSRFNTTFRQQVLQLRKHPRFGASESAQQPSDLDLWSEISRKSGESPKQLAKIESGLLFVHQTTLGFAESINLHKLGNPRGSGFISWSTEPFQTPFE